MDGWMDTRADECTAGHLHLVTFNKLKIFLPGLSCFLHLSLHFISTLLKSIKPQKLKKGT